MVNARVWAGGAQAASPSLATVEEAWTIAEMTPRAVGPRPERFVQGTHTAC